jgi:thermitase
VNPVEIVLEEVDDSGNAIRVLGGLVDDGSSGDLQSSDYVYSGTFGISSDAAGSLYFRTRANFPGIPDPIYSEPGVLYVTRFPTDIPFFPDSTVVQDPVTGADIVTDRILVSFVDGTEPGAIQLIINSTGGEITGTINQIGYYQVAIPDTGDAGGVTAAIDVLQTHPEVQDAEPVVVGHMSSVTPDDSYFEDEQSYLRRIRADVAWVTARGGPVIAVIDSGVDFGHPDLADKIIKGQNYLEEIGTPERWLPSDNMAHGTHVAGIAGAVSNNTLGISGVSWDSKILAIKALGLPHLANRWRLEADNVAAAITFAVDQGAKILNFSGEFEVPADPSEEEASVLTALKKSIKYANRRGSLVIVAAGNENSDTPATLGSLGSVMSVGAVEFTESTGAARWDDTATGGEGSNYGSWVDIAAPGKNIFATIPTYETELVSEEELDRTCPSGQPGQPGQRELEGCYHYFSGTSMATPMISGVAALVWSIFPEWTNGAIAERLINTATPLPGEFVPNDPNSGAGMVDAFNAVFNGSFEADEGVPDALVRSLPNWENFPVYYSEPGDPLEIWQPKYDNDFIRERDYGWYFFGYERGPYHSNEKILYGQGGGFIPNLGSTGPTAGDRMAMITTGRTGETWDYWSEHSGDSDPPEFLYAAFMEKQFYIQPGKTELEISYDYNFLTEDFYRYYEGCNEEDYFQVSLEIDGSVYLLYQNSVAVMRAFGWLTPDVGTIPLSEGWPVYEIGWERKSHTVPVPAEGGWATLRFYISDGPGLVCDSVLLIDNVEIN